MQGLTKAYTGWQGKIGWWYTLCDGKNVSIYGLVDFQVPVSGHYIIKSVKDKEIGMWKQWAG